ncbi:MAG: GntR family transcriptional regulator [Lachnospiraceae bacterium]|nr:GntR family transcriptional regulator [Lachnospiraceae bacterium]
MRDLIKNAPVYMQVYQRLKQEIQTGEYPYGSFLPNESSLEEIYDVSRTTIRKAIKMLADEGFLDVHQGLGTRVLDNRAMQNYNRVTSVTETLRKKGFEVTTAGMMIDIQKADREIANELNIAVDSKIARIQRLQLADGKPVTLMENYIEYARVPGIEAYQNDFVALYQFIEEKYGLIIDETQDKISAKAASFMESRILEVEPNEALLVVHRITYYKGQPVTVDHVRILGSQYEVSISGKGRLK